MKTLLRPLCFALLLSITTTSARAQESEVPDPPAAPAAADADSDEPTPLREQTIYIPYQKLREVFEREGRGVFLPYAKFQELWRQARANQAPQVDERPPVGVLITEVNSEATVERDVMTVQATLKIELLGQGWHQAPLRLKDAAIRSATINDQPARIVGHPTDGYKLLVKNENEEPTELELELRYSKAFTKSPGQNSVAFESPQAPVNRWQIRIPQPGVKVNVQPLIAATEVPAEDEAEETVVLAFVGAAPAIRVDWTPKSEGAAGLEALASVRTEQRVMIEEGLIRTRTQLTYDISRAELSNLTLEVPADHKVTGVFDPNVRRWGFEEGDEGVQTINVELFEPARSKQNITIELERFSDNEAMQATQAPVVRAVGVGRQQGIVVVRLADEQRAEATSQDGLLQLDAAELPKSLQNTKWAFAYRYATLPYSLTLAVEKVEPRVRVSQLVEAYLEPQRLTIEAGVILDIRRAGLFQVEFAVPAGFELRQVVGRKLAGAEPVVVDSEQREDNGARLVVNFVRKAIGRVGLVLILERSLNDPNLLTPTGNTSDIALPIPRVSSPIEDLAGRVVVYSPESLRVNPLTQDGLRDVSMAEAMQGVESTRGGRYSTLRGVLSLAHTNEPVALTLTAERRRPQVTIRQLLTARVESGVIKHDATLFYDVLYSAVKSLRVDVPADLAGDLRNVTPGVRDETIDPQPDDVADGYVAWSFTGGSEFLGSGALRLTWETQTEELGVGKTLDIDLPSLQPMEVDRAWGQIVLTKDETMDVQAAPGFDGLRSIDPQHDLMPGVQVADAARAFEFHDDWSLTVQATRYELQEPKRTSIERALVRMVVTRSGDIAVQALYRMRSVVQRLQVELPADYELDRDYLRIDGSPKAFESGGDGQLFIPVEKKPDETFVVELRYTVSGTYGRLDPPAFPAQAGIQTAPAVQKVFMSVFLPDELVLLGSRGPWTSEQLDWARQFLQPVAHKSDQRWIGWVLNGTGVDARHSQNFATDGRLYTFSTVRPDPPPDGSLRLNAMDFRVLNFLVFGAIAVFGVVFARQSLLNKLIALATVVVLVVLLGVFAPLIAMQVLDVNFVGALGLVILVWLVVTAYDARGRFASTTTAVNADEPPEAAAESDESAADDAAVDESTEEPAGDTPFGENESQTDDEEGAKDE